jgi:hypothetical protein
MNTNPKKHDLFKASKLKFSLRLLAIFDVLLAERFELTTWDKKGVHQNTTKFSKTEIDNAVKRGHL